MSNVSYVKHSLTGAVVLWIDDRPNEEAIAACEDPAYVFSARPYFVHFFNFIHYLISSSAFRDRKFAANARIPRAGEAVGPLPYRYQFGKF